LLIGEMAAITKTEGGFGPAQLDKASTDKKAIRRREQQLIDAHGGARRSGGTSGNEINGISERNKKKTSYIKRAIKVFGDLADRREN
jgi:hypothetical protein